MQNLTPSCVTRVPRRGGWRSYTAAHRGFLWGHAMSANRTMFLCAALLGLAGCAGMSQQACVSADWRTIGFTDGSLGRSVATIGSYRQQCGEHGVAPDLDAYRAGHAEGVQTYCRASNGFEVGH